MTEREPADLLAELTWLRRLAHTLVGERGAEDLAQDVAVAAVESPPPADRRRPWLAGVTRRLAARFHRDERRRASREREAARPLAGEAEQQAVERVRVHRQLVDAVLGLPEPWRRAVIGRYFDGRSPAQIARASGLTPGTVRQHLHRGLAELRRRLRDADGEAWRTRLAAAFPLGLFPSAIPALGVSLMAKKTALALTAAALLVSTWWLWPTAPERAPTTPADALAARAAVDADEGTDHIASTASAKTSGAPVERAAAGAPAPTFEVRVVDGAGSPCAETGVWIWTRAGEIEEFTTDADGKVSAPPREEAGGILVTRDRTARHELLLDALEGTHTVQLGDGTRLAGRVLVDGVPAEEPVTLELPVGLELPTFAYYAVARAGTPLTARVSSGPGGSFAFEGLMRGWSGTLRLDSRYGPHWFRTEGRGYELGTSRTSVAIPRPREDLELRLTRLPSVTGRVVWPDGRGADAALGVRAEFADGSALGPSTYGLGPAEGRFAIALVPNDETAQRDWIDPARRSPISRLTLTWTARGATGEDSHTWNASDFPADGSVGDLVLTESPHLRFLVVDEKGAPIDGAVVDGRPPNDATGPDGRGTLTFDGEVPSTFLVGAPGYLVEPLRGTGEGTNQDPLRFVVRTPANRLDVGVGTSGARGCIAKVVVTSTAPIFSSSGGLVGVSTMHQASGTPDCGSCDHSSRGHMIEFSLRRDENEVHLHSLNPGAHLSVSAVDALGQVVARREVIAPDPGEAEQIELAATAPPSIVRGVIRGPDGPLRGGSGALRLASAGPLNLRCDDDGTFEVRLHASGESGEILVDRRPYVTARHPLRLVPGTIDVHIDLVAGHDLDVTIVDAAGQPVAAEPRLAMNGDQDSHEIGRQELAPGRWRFDQLPPGPARLVAVLGTHRFAQDVRIPSSDVRMELPTPGTVRVRAPTEWQPAGATRLELSVVSLDTGGVGEMQPMTIDVRRGDQGWITTTVTMVPGRYRATVEISGDDPSTSRTLPRPVEFEVIAGTPVDVWIRPE